MLGALVAAPLGMGLAGPASATFGTPAVLLSGAAVAVLLTAVTLLVPAVWRIRGGHHGDDRDGADPRDGEQPSPAEPPSRTSGMSASGQG
jgi:hypothetical protein